MFGKSAKTLFDGELRLAYKWGAYRNIPLEKITLTSEESPRGKFLFLFSPETMKLYSLNFEFD